MILPPFHGAYKAGALPVISNVVVTDLSDFSFQVDYDTSLATSSNSGDVGPSGSYGTNVATSTGNGVTSHRVTFTSLNQNVLFYFRLNAGTAIPYTGTHTTTWSLPKVGPFASLSAQLVGPLSNKNVDSTETVAANSRTSPLKYKTFNVGSTSQFGVDFSAANTSAIFLWTDVLHIDFDGAIDVSGGTGGNGFTCGGAAGGVGGRGGSGGGGGGAAGSFGGGNGDGGGGGSGIDGTPGISFTCGGLGGAGGDGWGTSYNSGFTYGNGSDGFGGGLCGGAAGGNGFGGGGAGGVANQQDPLCCPPPCCPAFYLYSAGGGGGGGGSLACIVANQISFDAFSARIVSFAGSGGEGSGNCGSGDFGSSGGDGVVYIATRRWTPSAGVSFSANVYLFEITKADALVPRDVTDSWNNL